MKRMSTAVQIAVVLAAILQFSPTTVGQSPQGNGGSYLLIADFGRDCVRRYEEAAGSWIDTFVPRRSGGLNQPWGVLIGPHDRNVYVSSGEFAGPGQLKAVLRFDGTTGAFIDNFARNGNLQSPRGIIFGPDGHLYVADRVSGGAGRVARFHGGTGAYLGDFVTVGSGGLAVPTAAVFGPDNNHDGQLDLYVGSFGTDSVLHYDGASGAFLGAFVASGSGGLAGPGGMTFGPDGNLYVARYYSDQPAVLRFQGPSGPMPGTYMDTFIAPGLGGLRTCFYVIFGPDGNADGQLDLYVADSDFAGVNGKRGSIKRYDGVSGAYIDTFVAEGSGGLDDPGSPTFSNTDPVTLQYTGKPSAASRIETKPEAHPGTAFARVVNPFTGTYCGSLGSLYVGSLGISDSGRVSGYFDAGHQLEASLEMKGRVTAEGVMRLRVVDIYSDGGFISTERYSVTLTVALDEEGNLVGISGWGTPFVWSPCQ